MEKQKFRDRISLLQKKMKEAGVDYYLVPTADFHNSEYVSEYFKVREFLSGFTGSNGTLLVSLKEVGLWTDGRYFIQAKRELSGTGIQLFRMQEEGVPDIVEYLQTHMEKGQVLGFDGRVVTASFGRRLQKALFPKGISFLYQEDLVSGLWTNRPACPQNKVKCLPFSLSGEGAASKMERIRKEMEKRGASCFFLSRLDDIMWLFNVRGSDVECNPVALSYCLLTKEEAYLFLQEEAKNKEVASFLEKEGVRLVPYSRVEDVLRDAVFEAVLYDEKNTSYLHYKILEQKGNCIEGENPTEKMKAVKNETELSHMRQVFLQDSVAVTRFLYWLKNHKEIENLTEYTAAAWLDGLREKIPGFSEVSFPTISAYQENAAMMHYEAKEENSRPLKAEGMLLVDSGGQYEGGTTDVTRTVVLGKINREMKRHFTAVTCGMLRLSAARFLYGCTGRNLDILARGPLWDLGIDYKCGTGHGVGYMLNVHEGPQSIRWRYMPKVTEAVLEAGMVVTDEPGVYVEGSHGIRTENVLVVKKEGKTEDGQFLSFEPLTFVPVDLDGIEKSFMTEPDRQLLNDYHSLVYQKVSPYLAKEEQAWLKEATRPVI